AQIEAASGAEIETRDGLAPADYPALKADLTGGQGFDDIVVLDPRSAELVGEAAKLIARRGTFNMVGTEPLDGDPQIDVGRLHYDYTAYVGTNGSDIAASYGEARNRAELRAGGVAVFVGAGGPMGQMHVQRALELSNGPRTVIATDVNDERLATLAQMFTSLAEQRGKHLV
ncbi:alcohol dehydrogenase, partial [Kouleothrix aurantiaca]